LRGGGMMRGQGFTYTDATTLGQGVTRTNATTLARHTTLLAITIITIIVVIRISVVPFYALKAPVFRIDVKAGLDTTAVVLSDGDARRR